MIGLYKKFIYIVECILLSQFLNQFIQFLTKLSKQISQGYVLCLVWHRKWCIVWGQKLIVSFRRYFFTRHCLISHILFSKKFWSRDRLHWYPRFPKWLLARELRTILLIRWTLYSFRNFCRLSFLMHCSEQVVNNKVDVMPDYWNFYTYWCLLFIS